MDSNDSTIYAPFSGIISAFYPSKHAIGIVRDDGLEVLIHVGIDTVKLEGVGFDSNIRQGDQVNCRDILLTFDKECIQKSGYASDVFVVFTNYNDFQITEINRAGDIGKKDVLAYAKKI